MTSMKKNIITPLLITLAVLVSLLQACSSDVQSPQAANNPTSSSSPGEDPSLTLPVLDQLFSDKVFTAALKSKVHITDDQIAALKKTSTDELAKLHSAKAEN